MIICANFKTNHTRESVKKYLNAFLDFNSTHEVRIYPPATAFFKLENSKIKMGAQNFYPIQNGSFTGEIGKEQLDEFNITSVLIGHSERRRILKENDDLILKKFKFAKENKWEIVLCIGESKSTRDKGKTALFSFLSQQLSKIDLDYKNLIIAYEPIWAIGTGVVAKIKDVKEVLNFLREKTDASLLYGGSVNAENAREIFDLPSCDGVLVGNASLDPKNFQEIINKAEGL